jgi:hypothetical protein
VQLDVSYLNQILVLLVFAAALNLPPIPGVR